MAENQDHPDYVNAVSAERLARHVSIPYALEPGRIHKSAVLYNVAL